MAKEKKPEAVFELVFTGGGVYPEKIPIRKVVDALSAVKRLATGEILAEEDDETEDESDSGDVRLLDVNRSSSAVFRFVGLSPDLTIHRLREAGKILRNPETAGNSEYVLRPVKDLSAIAERLDCKLVLRESGKTHQPLAEIEPGSYKRISSSILIKGNTQISGIVQRVGGATERRCALRVPFQQKLLFCKVETNEVARQMGEALYQRVVAHGLAKWLRNSMRVFSFSINSVAQTKSGTLADHFQALWESGLDDWEKVENPDELLDEIRASE